MGNQTQGEKFFPCIRGHVFPKWNSDRGAADFTECERRFAQKLKLNLVAEEKGRDESAQAKEVSIQT
jgi:hypothetical protein